MDLRAEVQRLVQEYLATREEDSAWMRGGWCTEKCDVYARLRDYVCRKLCRRFEWREWLDVRMTVIDHVRELCQCDSSSDS